MKRKHIIAAVSSSALASGMAHGAILYSGPITSNNSFPYPSNGGFIDMNQDGTNDFVLNWNGSASKPFIVGVSNSVPGSAVLTTATDGLPLTLFGTLINSNYAPTVDYGDAYFYQNGGGTTVGSWGTSVSNEAYVGVEMWDGAGNTNYGWVRVIDNGTLATKTLTLVDYAYETTPFLGIIAGATNDASYPIIYSEPASQSVSAGTEVQMGVVALGAPTLVYQWQAGTVGSGHYTNLTDGGFIVGSSTPSLTITYSTSTNTADYVVVITNSAGIATSSPPATLTVNGTAPPPSAPVAISPPQSLVESVGDHVAFTVIASGTPPIHYQWQSNGVAIAGATSASYRLTNIVVAESATYAVICSSLFGTNTYSATLQVTPSLQALYSNNLVVARVGDSAQALSSSTANTLYLDQITTSGVYSNTIMVPDNVAATALIVPGGSPEGGEGSVLTMTANSNFLNFCRFNSTYPAKVTLLGGGVYRDIGGVDSWGYYSVPQLNDTLYTAEDIFNSAVSVDGFSEFWTTGSASSGGAIKYTDPATSGTAGGNVALGGSAAGTRVINLVKGYVVYSDVAASPAGIYSFTGEPTTAQGPTAIITDAAGNPNDFAASPDTDFNNFTTSTFYVADTSGIASGGGIQRFDWNGSSYVRAYTLGTGTNSTLGAGFLTVDFSAHAVWGTGVTGAKIYATTAAPSGNSLIMVVDTGATSNATVLAQANANEILRGVRFGPVPGPVVLVSNPQPTSVVVGATGFFTVSAMEGPFTYQWQLNGVNLTNGPSLSGSGATISGAQAGTLTIAHVGPADDQGQYSVIVSNLYPNSSLTTAAGLLTVPVNIT